MAESVITTRTLYLGGYDLTGDLNALALVHEIEGIGKARFRDTERTEMPGLIRTRLEASGLFDVDGVDEPDDVIPPLLRVTGNVVTAGFDASAAGQRCEMFRAGIGNYRRGGPIGQAFTFDVSAFLSNEQAVPGNFLFNGSQSGTGSGSAFQLGAVASGKFLYGALHVISVAGASPSITVRIQSDDNAGMTSATTRITFAAATAIGAEWATRVAGPITDDYWRMNCTVASGGPFGLVLAMGIL